MYGLVCGILKGMCAKVSKPLTSFQLASFLLVWDPIFFALSILAMHG